jgi:hypothetical protein
MQQQEGRERPEHIEQEEKRPDSEELLAHTTTTSSPGPQQHVIGLRIGLGKFIADRKINAPVVSGVE